MKLCLPLTTGSIGCTVHAKHVSHHSSVSIDSTASEVDRLLHGLLPSLDNVRLSFAVLEVMGSLYLGCLNVTGLIGHMKLSPVLLCVCACWFVVETEM